MAAFNHMNSYLRFCIDRACDHEVGGRVFSQRFLHPVDFTDLGNLVLFLEDVFDYQNYPQAFQSTRIIVESKSDLSLAAEEPGAGMTPPVVRAAHGSVATFDVLVVSRRSSSWQGSVDWLDGSERQEFSSYLELMHLINDRLFPDSAKK